jgi:hypothetical protein
MGTSGIGVDCLRDKEGLNAVSSLMGTALERKLLLVTVYGV